MLIFTLIILTLMFKVIFNQLAVYKFFVYLEFMKN